MHLRAQELCQTIGTSAVKRVVVQRHEQLLLYCLSQGAQAFICACTDRPDRAFAAFGFLSDVCARWGSKSERLITIDIHNYPLTVHKVLVVNTPRMLHATCWIRHACKCCNWHSLVNMADAAIIMKASLIHKLIVLNMRP